jgi:hypothetical protein
MSRTGKKLTKEQKRQRQKQKDAQEREHVVHDVAARFRSSKETAGDFAYGCHSACEDLEIDLCFRRLAHDIWRTQPGAGDLVSAMDELIAEYERHLAAVESLGRRFDALAEKITDEVLGADVVSFERVRNWVFPPRP